MAAAIAGEVHYTMLASAETLPGRAGALLRRCVCWAPEERDKSRGMGRLRRPRDGERSASAVAAASGQVLWQWLGAGCRFRGAGRAGVRMARIRDLRVRPPGKGQSCAERGPGASFYMHRDGVRAFWAALST